MGSDDRRDRLLALTSMFQEALDEDGTGLVSDEFRAELLALVLRLDEFADRTHLRAVDDA